jgi:hypothetical protein
MIKYNSKKSMITKFKYKESAPPGQCYVMSYSLCQSIIESLLHKHKRHVLNVLLMFVLPLLLFLLTGNSVHCRGIV